MTVNVNVNAQGLSQVLSALIALQTNMREVGRAARDINNQINGSGQGAGGRGAGANPPGGNRNTGGPSGGLNPADPGNLRALNEGARRESSAIVAAYAEIASTVFALSAAFDGLKRAAQFGSMLAAQDAFAKSTAVNMQSIAKALQQATNNALAFKEAAQFASIGRLAGFSTASIKELAQIGTSAATILGRDVPEALSRMFRGVAKGEPEILDELGIFIRLDNAYKQYVKTVAHGQKVFELTAYQRREATRLAAVEAGRQMAEGNPNARIDDFTIAAANFSNTMTTALLKITQVIGPFVKFLSENTTALLGVIALMGSGLIANLNNILLNQTRSRVAMEAAMLKYKDATSTARAAFSEGRSTGGELGRQALDRAGVISLQRQQIQATANTIAANERLAKSYKAAAHEANNLALRTGQITQAQFKARQTTITNTTAVSPDLMRRASSLAMNASMGGMVNDRTLALQNSLTNAIQRQNAEILAQQRAANGLALSWANVRSAMLSFGTAGVASLNRVTAAANVAVAAVKTFAIGVSSVAVSALGVIGIGFAFYQIGKMGAEALGIINKELEKVEDGFKNANIQLDKTFKGFEKMKSQKMENTFESAVSNANLFKATLDSTNTEVENLLQTMKGVKETEFDKLDLSQFADLSSKLNKLIPENSKASEQVWKAVRAQLDNAKEMEKIQREINPLKYGGMKDSRVKEYEVLGKSLKSFTDNAQTAKAPIAAIQAFLSAMIKQTTLLQKGTEQWVGALEAGQVATNKFAEAYDNVAKTMKAESSFNAPIEAIKQQVVALRLEIEKFSNTDIKALTPDAASSMLAQTMASVNAIRTEYGMAEVSQTAISDLGARYAYTNEVLNNTLNSLKKQTGQLESMRKAELNATAAADAKSDSLNKFSNRAAKAGIDLSAYVKLLDDLSKKDTEIAVANKKASFLSRYQTSGKGLDQNPKTAQADAKEIIGRLETKRAQIVGDIIALKDNVLAKILSVPTKLDLDYVTELETMLRKTKKLKESDIIALGNQVRLWESINDAVKRSMISLVSYSDLLKSNASLSQEIFVRSINEGAQAYIAQAKANNVQLSDKELDTITQLNDQMTIRTNLLKEQYNRQTAMNGAILSQAEATRAVKDAMLDLDIQGSNSAREMKILLSTFNTDAVSKIAEIENKLRELATSKAMKASDTEVSLLSNRDISFKEGTLDPYAKAYKDASDRLHDLQMQQTVDLVELQKASFAVSDAEAELRAQRKKTALEQVKDANLTATQMEQVTRRIRSLDWSKSIGEAITNFVKTFNDALNKGANPEGGGIMKVVKEQKNVLNSLFGKKASEQREDGLASATDAIKKYFKTEGTLGSKILSGLKNIGGNLTKDFPKLTGAFSAAIPQLAMAATANSKQERNANIGGAVGGAIGSIFGEIGIAIGSTLGSLIGSAFTKKLTATGFDIKVSAAGDLVANEIAEFKKKSLTGTKRSTQIIGALNSEASAALQNVIDQTQKTYVNSLLAFNSLTSNRFNLSLKQFGAFQQRYTQAAGGNANPEELLKNFVKDYGNFVAKDTVGFLSTFQTATESLVDVLNRMTNTLISTNSAFTTLFGKGIGILGNMSKSYVSSFLESQGEDTVSSVTDTLNRVEDATKDRKKSKFKKLMGGLLGSAIFGSFGLSSVLGGLINPVTGLAVGAAIKRMHDKSGDKFYDAQGRDLRVGMSQELEALRNKQPIEKGDINSVNLYFNNIKALIDSIPQINVPDRQAINNLALLEKYINGVASEAEVAQVFELARLDYMDRLVKSFEGEDIKAKTEAYNKAIGTYTSVVSASVVATANSFEGMITQLSAVDASSLPYALSATKNGLLMPIQEFNRALQVAVEKGISPEKMAEALKLGSKLGEVIQGILDSFGQINISDALTKSAFKASTMEGIAGTFKSSAIDNFKKSLMAPLLSDLTASIASGTFNSSMTDYNFSGNQVVNSAKQMAESISDPAFKAAMESVTDQFDKLLEVFSSLDTSKVIEAVNTSIIDISKAMKLSAYSFAVSDNAVSVNIFKAREALKEAGLSADLASKPIDQVFATIKDMAAKGQIGADKINAVNEALQAMADIATSSREELVKVSETSSQVLSNAQDSIKNIVYAIIDDSGSLEAAKASLEGILSVSKDKLNAANAAYNKAKATGNSLLINQAAETLTSALETYTQDQIQANTTLKDLAEQKYQAEKSQLENLQSIITDINAFLKDLKFDETLSILKPIDRLTAADSTFEQLKQKVTAEAAAGTFTADSIKTLQDDAKRLLELGRDVYASGDQYTNLYNEVANVLAQVSGKAAEDAKTYEASTTAYQASALEYAKQTRDIQLSSLASLEMIARASAIDNAISVDLINALKYNSGLPAGSTLTDYYNNLFNSATGTASAFTKVGTGFQDFKDVGNYNTSQTVEKDVQTAKLNEVLDKLTTVLANLPVDVKSAIQSTSSLVTKRN